MTVTVLSLYIHVGVSSDSLLDACRGVCLYTLLVTCGCVLQCDGAWWWLRLSDHYCYGHHGYYPPQQLTGPTTPASTSTATSAAVSTVD